MAEATTAARKAPNKSWPSIAMLITPVCSQTKPEREPKTRGMARARVDCSSETRGMTEPSRPATTNSSRAMRKNIPLRPAIHPGAFPRRSVSQVAATEPATHATVRIRIVGCAGRSTLPVGNHVVAFWKDTTDTPRALSPITAHSTLMTQAETDQRQSLRSLTFSVFS